MKRPTEASYLAPRLHGLPSLAKRIALFCVVSLLLAVQAHATGNFANTGSMIHARYYHSATLLNDGRVLIAGGYFPFANVLQSAELYDPISESFSLTGYMTVARYGQSATLLQDGRVLLAGGTGAGSAGPLSAAEVYDPATGQFTPTNGPMTMPRIFHTAALLPNGMVLLAGGRNNTGILSSAELYDPSTGTFSPTGSLSTPREGSNIHITPSAILSNGSVLIAGGYNGVVGLSSAELYNPSTGTFTLTTGNMTTPRWFHEVTLLRDGTVLITAGHYGGYQKSAETYDPSTQTFTATTGQLITARFDHTATLLQNGKVLVTGGVGTSNVPLNSSELYDPSSRTFVRSGVLQTSRMLHTATLLQNGTVLIAGGSDGTKALSSAELFIPGIPSSPLTYYISYSTGSNTNDGTSKSTPWKTHPYMQASAACTGIGMPPNYVHTTNDVFVFKQGDSWPNACFDMVIQAGGDPWTRDQYTFDSTWGVPPMGSGATTGNRGQVVGAYRFDAGGAVIHGQDGINRFIYDDNNDNIVFNGVELTGVTWSGNGGGGDNVWLVDIQGSRNFILSNCYAHNWTYTNPIDGGDALAVMVGIGNGSYNIGSAMSGCVVDGSNSGGPGVANSGDATFAVPGCDNNIIMNVTNGCLVNANGSVHDNIIGPINLSFSASAHANCIEPIDPIPGGTSTIYIYNNVIHDCTASGILTQGTPAVNSNEIDYIWNNVIYASTQQHPPIPVDFDSRMSPNTGSEVHAWNNTIFAGLGNVCFRTHDEGNGNFSVIDLQNNFCISDLGLTLFFAGASTEMINNNVVMSFADAATAGLSAAQTFAFQPTAADCGGGVPNCPVGAGTNLTGTATGPFATLANDTTYGGQRTPQPRPTTGAVDAGAYQF